VRGRRLVGVDDAAAQALHGRGKAARCARAHLVEDAGHEPAPENRVGKNPVFYIKKTSPMGFFVFFWFFLYICPEERVFMVFSVSRILLGASRL